MIKAVVEFHVKDGCVKSFREISLANAASSIKEPGISGFDVLQRLDDETKFVFIESYLTADDQLKHRETAHYKKWKGLMENMLAEPRVNVKYNVLNG